MGNNDNPTLLFGVSLSPKFYYKHYLEKLEHGDMERKAHNQHKEIVVNVS